MYSYLKNVHWLPTPNKVELYFANHCPQPNKLAAVFAFIFNEAGELLMIQQKDGRWNIPGGGAEAGETIEQTAIREVMEEACVEITNLEVVAYQRLLQQGERKANCPRPYPESYEVFVSGKAKQNLPFKKSNEAINRQYFSIKTAVKQDGILYENRHVIFDKARLLLKK